MRVIIYPRVSSLKQLKEGDSIDAQTNRLKRFCEQNDYDILDTYTDGGKSASIKEDDLKQRISGDSFINNYKLNVRPAFKKLLKEASEKKFDAIIFYKWDRFARDIAFAELSIRYFKQYGITLIPTDDSIDPLVSSIVRAMGKAEIDKMKERVRNTRLNRFEKGMMPGKAPVGYRWNKIKKIMEVHKRKADIVKDLFKMTSLGAGYREICEKHKLKPQSYYNIIKNKVYMGIITFEGEENKGIHSPLISKELFDKVNQK